jgi:hypothetical protein
MNGEHAGIPMIRIGVDSREQIATVSPPAMVVEAHSQVAFRLESYIKGTAEIRFPAEGPVIHLTPGEAKSIEVTRTGVYYTVVTLQDSGKVAAMAVLICDG